MHLYMYMHWYSNSMLSSACSFRSYSQAAKQLTGTNIPQRYSSLAADALIYTRVVETDLAPPFSKITDMHMCIFPKQLCCKGSVYVFYRCIENQIRNRL